MAPAEKTLVGAFLRTFHGVQAMRGLAALSVVCGHALTARPDLVSRSAGEGALTILAGGVDIFFVISGFIIAATAASRPDAMEFAFRRALRIYPVYWLVLLAAFASAHWIALAPEDRPAPDFGLIFAWTYPNWYNAPAWSIAFELHFYAAVAVILAIAPHRLFQLLFAGLAVVAVAIIFHAPLGIYAHPLVLEFGEGVAIAYLLQRRNALPCPPYVPAVSAVLFVAGWYWIFVHGASDPQSARVPTYGLGAGCLIYAVVSAELNGARFSSLLQWLGRISYSLYISHYLLIKWLASFTDLWLISSAGVIIAGIVLSIGLAAALHVLVEAPTLDWGRRFRPMRPAAARPAVTPPGDHIDASAVTSERAVAGT
jgi:peptidoglycan/LPS O-acetylase OafA/YrhL